MRGLHPAVHGPYEAVLRGVRLQAALDSEAQEKGEERMNEKEQVLRIESELYDQASGGALRCLHGCEFGSGLSHGEMAVHMAAHRIYRLEQRGRAVEKEIR